MPDGKDVTVTIKLKDSDVDKGEEKLKRLKTAADNLSKPSSGTSSNQVLTQQEKLARFLGKDVPDAANKAAGGMAEVEAASGGAAEGLAGVSAAGGPVGIVLAAVATAMLITVGVAFALAKEVTHLAKEFADYGLEIDKAMRATGLAAETISALRHEAERTGESFGSIEGPLAQFRKTVSEAATGSEDARKKLKLLGIDGKKSISDIDGAFKTAITNIAKLPAGLERAKALYAAFGDDAAKVIPIIDSMGGSVDEAIKKARELGIVLSGQDVQAAKEFNKAYADVEAQVKGIAYSFGREFLPIVGDALRDFSKWVGDNKSTIASWATATGNFVSGVIGAFKELIQFINDHPIITRIILGVETFGASEATIQTFKNLSDLGAENHLPKPATRDQIEGRTPKTDPTANYLAGLSDKKPKVPSGGENEMRRFFEEQGFRVVRTFGSELNKGSLHPLGRAIDLSIQGKTTDQITNLVATAIQAGYRLFDERVKRPGVFQTGPHLHFEKNPNKPSDFLGQGFYDVPLSYLQSLDKQRLGKGTITKEELEQFLGKQSDKLTKADRDKLTQQSVEFYKRAGLVPTGEMLDRFRSYLAEEAKKAGTVQPTEKAITDQFTENARQKGGQISTTGATVSGNIAPRTTLDQEYIKSLRDALGTEQAITDLVLERRNLTASISAIYEDSITKQGLQMVDIEKELGVLQKQNADAEFVAQRRTLAAKSEQLSLELEITQLQDAIANAGINDSLIIEAEHLKDVLAYRQEELSAVIAINRAQYELSHSQEISTAKIKAGVLQHLAEQKTLNQAISDGINQTYDELAKKQDDLIDGLFRWAGSFKSLFTEPLKFFAHEGLKNLTTGLLDAIVPGLGAKFQDASANPIARPIVTEIRTTNKLLGQLVVGSGGSGVSGLGSLGSILGSLGIGATGGVNLGTNQPGAPLILNSTGGLGNSGGGLAGLLGALGVGGAAGGASGGGGLGGVFGRIIGPGGIFGDKGFGNNVGTFGGIGAIGGIVGSAVGGKVGGIISSTASGLAIGAQIGSIIPGIGTAIGAAVGAVVGFFAGLFGGDPKRKKDHDENIPNLQKGFSDAIAQLNGILQDMRAFQIEPDQAIKEAADVRAQIASGFGIKFESSKYQKIAKQQISSELIQADQIINQIKASADIARGAADRSKRILPEFAGGVYFADYFKPNGLLPGMFDGKDNILAMISKGEMVLNPTQQNRVRALAGTDVFAGAGIPNYPKASASPKLAIGGIAGASLAIQQTAPQILFQPHFSLVLDGVSFDDKATAYLESDTGVRTQVRIQKKLKKSGDI